MTPDPSTEDDKAAMLRGGEGVRILIEKHREDGVDIIDMGMCNLMIQKIIPHFYQHRFNNEWSSIKVLKSMMLTSTRMGTQPLSSTLRSQR